MPSAGGSPRPSTVDGTTQFLYDGFDVAQRLEPQRTTTYPRSLAIDETLGFATPEGSFYLTADALGSTLAVGDATGGALSEYSYDPFGVTTVTNATLANPFQFTGREKRRARGPLLLPGALLPSRAAEVHQRGPERISRSRIQSLCLCWRESARFSRSVRALEKSSKRIFRGKVESSTVSVRSLTPRSE